MQPAKEQRFSRVWDAIEDTPQAVASLRTRSDLMMRLAEAMKVQGLTQVQAAAFFGVTQPRISELARGKITLFTLDALMDMASTAGMRPTITVTMPKKAIPSTVTRKTYTPPKK